MFWAQALTSSRPRRSSGGLDGPPDKQRPISSADGAFALLVMCTELSLIDSFSADRCLSATFAALAGWRWIRSNDPTERAGREMVITRVFDWPLPDAN